MQDFLKLPIHVVSRQSDLMGFEEEPRETYIKVKRSEIVAYRPNVWEGEDGERPITTITLSTGHEYDITTSIDNFEELFKIITLD